MAYEEDDFLQLSGLQHFAFCRRQWALIHIEQQWRENAQTVEGELLHTCAHDADDRQTHGSMVCAHGVYVHSTSLGVSGQCDVVEYHRSETGVQLHGKEGLWQPYPVEYKRGETKTTDEDRLQLCGQAMCLEEMLCCDVPQGALFYGKTRRREKVDFTPELRRQVQALLQEMHRLYVRGYTPNVKPKKACTACSVREICLPKLLPKRSAAVYIASAIRGDA